MKLLSMPKIVSLTPREKDILRGVMAGHTYAVLADKLGLRYDTLRSYVKKLRKKLGIASKSALAVWAVRHSRSL